MSTCGRHSLRQLGAVLLVGTLVGSNTSTGYAQSMTPAARQRALEEEQAKARADFFAHSVPTPSVPGVPQPGEKNPYAEALKQLMTPQPDGDQPSGQLVGAYRDYIFLRRCFDSRAEFALVYVTPEELAAAKVQIKSVEEALIQQDPSIDKDERWATANRLNEEMADNLIVRMDPGQQAVARREYSEPGSRACRSVVIGLRDRFEKLHPDARAGSDQFGS